MQPFRRIVEAIEAEGVAALVHAMADALGRLPAAERPTDSDPEESEPAARTEDH